MSNLESASGQRSIQTSVGERSGGDLIKRWICLLTLLLFAGFFAADTTAAGQGGLNLFKFGDSTSTTATGWSEVDYFLNLPNQGSPAANWAQNSSALRPVMSQGNPIYDSYIDAATGEQIPTTGFLNAERNLLENHGWSFNPQTGAYHPPIAP